MINEKNIEKINLILKNAKVNLNLAYINLNYKSKEIELINNEKLVNIIDKIKIIENNLDNFLSFINHEKEELEKVEIKNNELMIDLINNTEKSLANTQLDATNSIEVEKTNVNLNTVSSTEFISKSVIKTDANVAGIKQVVTKVISTISSIFKKVTGAEVKSDVTSNQPTKTNNSSFLRNINGSLNQISNSLVSNIAKIIKVDESIVNNFVQKVNNYVQKDNNYWSLVYFLQSTNQMPQQYNFWDFVNYLNINKYSSETINIKNLKQLKEIFDAREISERDFFKKIQTINGTKFYGNDQGYLSSLIHSSDINDVFEVIRLAGVLHEEYGLSFKDSAKTFKYLNSIGICEYASFADSVSSNYATNPIAFAQRYGFNLYIEDINGNVRLNTGELLLHNFILNNTNNVTIDKYGDGTLTYEAPIFCFDENYNLFFNDKALKYSYTYDDKGIKINNKPVGLGGQKHIASNELPYTIATVQHEPLLSQKSYSSKSEIYLLKNIIEDNINNGELLEVSLHGSDAKDSNGNYISSWKLLNTDTGIYTNYYTGGHRVKVTGYESDGIILSTWSGEHKLLYKDIVIDYPSFSLYKYTFPNDPIIPIDFSSLDE